MYEDLDVLVFLWQIF